MTGSLWWSSASNAVAVRAAKLGTNLQSSTLKWSRFAAEPDVLIEDAFALVREAATAGIDISNGGIHRNEMAARDHCGVDHIHR